jgi:hypothetical protein
MESVIALIVKMGNYRGCLAMDDLTVLLIFILMVIVAIILAVGFQVKLAPADYNNFGMSTFF